MPIKKGILLAFCSKQDTFQAFLTYFDMIQQPCVLIRHNSTVFDTPRLMYQLSLSEGLLSRALEMPLYFGSSSPLLRKLSWINNYKVLGSVYQNVTGKTFNVHDTLKDSTALQACLTTRLCYPHTYSF